MADAQYYDTAQGRRLAYHQTQGTGPGVVFLGGFVSDMEGTKAVHLEDWAKAHGRAYLRFDYSGHGRSSEDFRDGSIGDWAQDAATVVSELTDTPQILVGSSMGGWISLLLAKKIPERIAGIVGIAAAPDFTEDSMWAAMTDAQKADLDTKGFIELPSDYSEAPYVITRKLIEDGRNQLTLRDPLNLPFPVRLLHGTADVDVAMSVPLRLIEHATGPDIQLSFVKDVDHRFSGPRELAMIEAAITDITAVGGHAQ